MQAVVLAGGEGTRLRPLTETVPKTVLPLCGKPFTAYTIDWLEQHGVDEVVLSCGYLADGMKSALDGATGPRLVYEVEPEPLGTAGAIGHCRDLVGQTFFAMNGDILSDLDLSKLVEVHEASGARATIGLYPVEDPSSYGLVFTDPDGKVSEFREKPEPGADPGTDEINAGIYLLDRSVFDLIEPGKPVSIEREVFPLLAEEGSLYGVRLEGYWMDIGTPDRFLQATEDILSGKVRTAITDELGSDGIHIASDADVSETATVVAPALIGSGASVASGATVGPGTVLESGCQVGDGASVAGSALFAGCEIGDGATVSRSILSAGVQVEPGAAIPEGTVAAEGERLSG
jgi:mannose-1-phosphate guanylyltransferase